MATLTIRNVPDRLHARLAARAAAHGRSVGAEALAALDAFIDSPAASQAEEAASRLAQRHEADLAEDVRRFHATLPPGVREIDPAAWIREDRDAPDR